MSDIEKHCHTCAFSYYPDDTGREYCNNEQYNSPNYTHDMLMEDWDQVYCRFWAPKMRKE